jgi:hypothetical protein
MPVPLMPAAQLEAYGQSLGLKETPQWVAVTVHGNIVGLNGRSWLVPNDGLPCWPMPLKRKYR